MAVPRHWEKGEVIFREGDGATPATCSAPARSCSPASTRTAAWWRWQSCAPDALRRAAMFRGETRSATAEAIEAASAVALLASDVQRLIRRYPGSGASSCSPTSPSA